MASRGIVFLVLLSAAVVSGCTATGVATEQAAGFVDEEADNAAAPLKEFSIESGHVTEDGKQVPRFLTKEITVNKGDKVKISVTNIKGRHDFTIDEFSVFSETPINETVTVEFVAGKAGEFVYYCSKPGHRANGHWGTLRVLE